MENEEKYSVGSLCSDGSLLPGSRDEPDGQSEISVTTPPELVLPAISDPPSLSVTTPPPTPLTANGNYKPRITPAMIQSALEALQTIENKQTPLSLTPREDTLAPIFSEAVTSALTAWISSQNSSRSAGSTPFVSPPPSTPLEATNEAPCRTISASDLIAALSSLMPSDPKEGGGGGGGGGGGDGGGGGGGGDGSDGGSIENSNPCTVPSCTPQEGISEWYKLGIRPEDVIQALSALTIQERERGEEQNVTLSPITEEQPSFPRAGRGGGVVEDGHSRKKLSTRERGEGKGGEEEEEEKEEEEGGIRWEVYEEGGIGGGRERRQENKESEGAEADQDCSEWPSDVTDSENSVFSPEPGLSPQPAAQEGHEVAEVSEQVHRSQCEETSNASDSMNTNTCALEEERTRQVGEVSSGGGGNEGLLDSNAEDKTVLTGAFQLEQEP